ncbi:MAG: alkaline phosphatase [Robiginitomaculum sp.]|nr:MAG: alkaline phosphatase [Robiginitomaculum sp.]
MPKITRRGAIFTSAALLGTAATGCQNESLSTPVTFMHGVASGDPTQNSIILWTRISPQDPNFSGSITGYWEVSTSKDFDKIVKKGKFTTSPTRDYTVKIDAKDLKSGQTYYYRFKAGETFSPTGRTKVLPNGSLEKVRLAVVSCSNYPFGFFNIYDHIAKQDHFDAVIHLGDYFYEYGRDGYGGKVGAKLGREHEPAHEVITLSDYRIRHAQYKGDPSTQAMHTAHPLIAVWDDHETANDSWSTGAENHNADEGSWDDRRTAAMQAYYEWMPVRDPQPGQAREALFRNYEFGDLLSLTSIETRLTARTRPIDYAHYISDLQTREGIGNFVQNILGDPTHEMMGEAQRDYVGKALKSSKDKKQPWRLIANQVIMARTASPDLTAYKDEEFIKEIEKLFPQIYDYIALSPIGLPLNPDAWDGYPAARERFYKMATDQGVQDLLVLTGDTHDNWANKLESASGTTMGVELGVSGVTSPGTGAYFGSAGKDFSERLNAKNPDILYHDNQYHSYIDLSLTHEGGHAAFIGLDTIYSPEYKTSTIKEFKLVKHEDTIKLEEA